MSENKPPVITRIFDAPRASVWQAWTVASEVQKWWGPKYFTAPEVRLDFSEGGKYVYCMRGAVAPGQPVQDFWSAGTFIEIIPQEKIVLTDHFSDKDGNPVHPSVYGMGEMPELMHLTVTFEDEPDNKTKLTITYADVIPQAHKKDMLEGWKQSLDKMTESLN